MVVRIVQCRGNWVGGCGGGKKNIDIIELCTNDN